MKTKNTTIEGSNLMVTNLDTGEARITKGDYAMVTIKEYCMDEVEESKRLILFNDENEYVKNFRGNGILFNTEKISGSEVLLLMFILDYVCYSDCIVRKNGNKNGKPLSIQDIAKLKGVSKSSISRTLSELEEHELISFHDSNSENNNETYTVISVNPFMFCRGQYVEKWVIEHYSNTKWATMPRRKKRGYKLDKSDADFDLND